MGQLARACPSILDGTSCLASAAASEMAVCLTRMHVIVF